MTFFDAAPALVTQGLIPATDGPETTDLGMMPATAAAEAIDRNWWSMRQRRINEKLHGQLGDLADAIYGDRDAWQPPAEDADALVFPGQMTPRQRIEAERGLGHDARIAEMFDALGQLREVEPGQFANFPGSWTELEAQARADAIRELREERDDAERRIANRSEKTILGGVAAFAGAAAAAITDIEGLAILPFGAGATLARRVLIESALGVGTEAATLPAYNKQAEALGRDAPNPALMLLFGAGFGAGLPLAGAGLKTGARGLGKGVRITNDALIRRFIKSEVPAERGAATGLARDQAARDMSPEGVNPEDQLDRMNGAEAAMDAGEPVIVRPGDIAGDIASGPARHGRPGRVRRLLDFIGSAEAPQGYDQVYSGSAIAPPQPVTSMTLSEVLAWQDRSVAAGAASSAAGRYQIVRDTLRGLIRNEGLSGGELFDAAMQDRLAIALMRQKGLDEFLAGQMNAATFGNGLAQVWAGLPRVAGRGAGDGVFDGFAGNNNTVSADAFIEILTAPGPYRPLGIEAAAGHVLRFPLDDLRVDAQAYQYKLDADAAGINARLLGEREWDGSAGVGVMVHERLDGDRFIADGHQRFALAKRLSDEGQDGIELQGFLYREADGFSVEEVRALAALRNIRAETGDPASAAKIIRDYPEMVASISRARSFMQQAEGLAQLHPGPFQAVINAVVPQHYGAIVGRVIPDDEQMQAVAVAALARIDPANQLQAESVVRDIRRLGLERKAEAAQGALFGDEFDLGASAIGERARVIDATTKELKRDRAVFARLTRDDQRIEGAGNVLNKAENQTRQAQATKALEKLIIEADRGGRIQTAIDAAARSLRGGATPGDAIRPVIEAVTGSDRPAGSRGNADRVGDNGPAGANGDRPAPVGDAPRDPDLFGDPVEGRGVIAQIDTLETQMRARLGDAGAGDLKVNLSDDGKGKPVRLSEILEDHAEGDEFFEQLKLCMPKGAQT